MRYVISGSTDGCHSGGVDGLRAKAEGWIVGRPEETLRLGHHWDRLGSFRCGLQVSCGGLAGGRH